MAEMQRGYLIAVCLACHLAAAGWAASVVQATVVSMDRDNGRIVALESGTMRVITVSVSPAQIPGSVRVGTPVTLWGDFADPGAGLFRATRIGANVTGGGSGWQNDPTGVRSRLFRGKAGGKP